MPLPASISVGEEGRELREARARVVVLCLDERAELGDRAAIKDGLPGLLDADREVGRLAHELQASRCVERQHVEERAALLGGKYPRDAPRVFELGAGGVCEHWHRLE